MLNKSKIVRLGSFITVAIFIVLVFLILRSRPEDISENQVVDSNESYKTEIVIPGGELKVSLQSDPDWFPDDTTGSPDIIVKVSKLESGEYKPYKDIRVFGTMASLSIITANENYLYLYGTGGKMYQNVAVVDLNTGETNDFYFGGSDGSSPTTEEFTMSKDGRYLAYDNQKVLFIHDFQKKLDLVATIFEPGYGEFRWVDGGLEYSTSNGYKVINPDSITITSSKELLKKASFDADLEVVWASAGDGKPYGWVEWEDAVGDDFIFKRGPKKSGDSYIMSGSTKLLMSLPHEYCLGDTESTSCAVGNDPEVMRFWDVYNYYY